MADERAIFDVIVVGAGPVGAIAALLLGREGLNVLAVEAEVVPYDKPRAIGIDHESMRALQKLGVMDDLAPYLGAYRASEYRSASGDVLRRIIPQPEPHPLSWPPYSTFIQPELERLLRAAMVDHTSIDARFGWRCERVTDDGEGVSVELLDPSGKRLTERARYVVACDGAWSPVRESLGISFEDLQFDEPWLVVDVHVNDRSNLPDTTVQYCDPSRPATLVHGPGDLCRWEIMLLPGEDPADMVRDDAVWSLLSRWLRPGEGRLWRAATYRFHALVAESWGKGRVFIAGDAAHQTPPFMAQGLNQGIRDVINLSWKLAEVIRHGANPALLGSYETERRPNCRSVIELTKELGRLICERDGERAAERDRKLLDEMASGRGEIVRQDLLPPIADGFLFRDATGRLSPGAGVVFPQPVVEVDGAEGRMDDVLQARHLLVLDDATAMDASVRERAMAMGIAVVALDGGVLSPDVLRMRDPSRIITTMMGKYGAAAMLVRPDHLVFGSVSRMEDAGRLLSAFEVLRDREMA
ncbi:bifunctional 3-(3-hydroxy-phenyl)propionate/3-hydroxycinnamic acid hydroxylase [Sphingobium sp.]|uniref:bifunctional 3-(3-hydroxy-phenyl)propionate/3-hydroxycinnamic acid hydroxylase n=1 Tax=Sphingobium sp. TaxID=1912891 RepID=UPI0028BE353F|nr:bifunctional 3-(3-hydroxy-phenyl)propionate/3-hydroxycinnamic acid hydroxylase [Sphingobium sp.]